MTWSFFGCVIFYLQLRVYCLEIKNDLTVMSVLATHKPTLQQEYFPSCNPWKSFISKYGCTLYNPTSRLATGHRSAQSPYGAPKEGGAMENGWKQGGRRSGGETDESPPPPPPPPVEGRFHAVWQAEWTEWARECALPCCVSLCNLECVGVTRSVRLSHWKASNVFVWSEGRISGRQCREVIPVFFGFFHSFLPFLPSSLPRSLVRFLFSLLLFFAFTTVRES